MTAGVRSVRRPPLELMRRLWTHLSQRRRRQLGGLLGLMTLGAFAEVVSLGAAVPFFGVLMAPNKVLEQDRIGAVARGLGLDTPAEVALGVTIAFVLAAVLAGAVRLMVLFFTTRLSFAVGVDLSSDMYRRTLYQPYAVHVGRNTSAVITGITTKTSTVVSGVVMPVLQFLSATVLLVAIIWALVSIDARVTAWAAAGFGAAYVVVVGLTRARLSRASGHLAAQISRTVQALQEGLGGIRDVLLDGTQPRYVRQYHVNSESMRSAQASIAFISGSPRFAMEALGIALLAMLAYSISRQPGGISASLPVLGALTIGAQRLIPALQQLFASWSQVAGTHASLTDVLELLDQPLPPEAYEPLPSALPFEREVRISGVTFRYHPEGPLVLSDLNLRIAKGSRVGIVGSTGSGKSTAMDVLMGLLKPTSGDVLVDNQQISGSAVRQWQMNIAHVPQAVYLADATVAENIAFGIPPNEIDMDRVLAAARNAHIAEHFENAPDGFQTFVGERGMRLSGGQRQRIGIARALYKRAALLVFDEATSALDTVTEKAVMDSIDSLARDLTVVVIAHRLVTVQRCDVIFELKDGKVVASGTYDELLRNSESFRAMARRPAAVVGA